MSIKNRILKTIERLPFALNCIIKLNNQLRLDGNQINILNAHFRRNKVELRGSDESVRCGVNSFIQNGSIRMSGDKNNFRVGDNSAIYGENGQVVLLFGNNNRIVLGDNCQLRKVSFFVRGNGNTIIVEDGCSAYNVEFHVEQDGNEVCVGMGTTMHGREGHAIHIAADEGSRILIGEDCMLAHSIQMRSTDSHSIVNMNGERTNPAKDIVIGKHCWLGLQSIILKGTELSPNTVVAAGAVCSKRYGESNCILAGNPAMVVKREINWDRKFV